MTNETLYLIINDTKGNQLIGNTEVCIKINRKTQIKTQITDGILNITIPTDTFKNPTYKLTIILGENSLYNKATYNGTLIVVKPSDIL